MYENQMMEMIWCLEGYVYETRIVNKTRGIEGAKNRKKKLPLIFEFKLTYPQ